MTEPAGSERKPSDETAERASWSDPTSAMTPRFNWLLRRFAKRYFRHLEIDPEAVRALHELEERGSLIYVMRYSSRLDYFLFNTLFAREGLRLSCFANGIRFHTYRPVFEALRTALGRMRFRSAERRHRDERETARRLALGGQSLFLFLRTARFRSFLRGRFGARRTDELDLLEEIVGAVWDTDRPVFLVPLAIFWRKGPRSENRFLNLSYGSLTRPSDLAKVSSFLATYRSLAVKVGESIDLQAFIADQRNAGPGLVARKVRRSILVDLYREEKVVVGPTLRALHRVQREVLDDVRVRAVIRERAEAKKWSEERAHRQAERFFYEIAANMNSTFLAALNAIVNWIFRRVFTSVEVEGMEKVANALKLHPVVLIPSHRSYFDFMILSSYLYSNYMMPPHIAARENMAFGPFGYIFRRAGAFFLRNSFDDALYKEVFRSYVAYLVREGFVQEFFIEGGRSRTGKMLAPRLGMLSWDIEAFLESSQSDLVLIPVAITYERLVEETAMLDELQGGRKTEESVLGLVRARKYLQRRFGSVHVRFGEPISVAEALGGRRSDFARPESSVVEDEKRRFIEDLGWRIVEGINWTAVANATSLAASVMMGSSHRGLRREELVERMQQFMELLRLQGTRLTQALEADAGTFEESIAFLLRADLVRSVRDARGEVLYFDESRRQALDLYRNAIVHFLAVPSFLARSLLAGARPEQIHGDLALWQEIFYQEFYSPSEERGGVGREAFLNHFSSADWISTRDGRLVPTAVGEVVFECLAEQTRSVIDVYSAACEAAAQLEEEVDAKQLNERIAAQFECAELLGNATRGEAANDTTYSNARDMLVRRGVLRVGSREIKGKGKKGKKGKKSKREERVYVRVEDARELEFLRSRLRTLEGRSSSKPR